MRRDRPREEGKLFDDGEHRSCDCLYTLAMNRAEMRLQCGAAHADRAEMHMRLFRLRLLRFGAHTFKLEGVSSESAELE